MADRNYNAVVVGAGAGGGVVAKQLATAGLSVLLLERGGWPVYDEHINDELISQRTWILGTAFGPDGEKNPRVIIRNDGSREVIGPTDGWDYNHIAACVGSGTVSYGAMAWRFMPEDFTMRSTYGEVLGSTLEDWPVTYEELEPYYERAEWEIGVAGDDFQNPFAPPRRKPHPMPPFEYNREANVLKHAAHKLGLHPFPIPMLRNSIPYNGRAACIRNRTCCGFACPVDGKNGTQNTTIPEAIRTGNCDLKIHCKVTEVILDTRGRAKGVRYFDEQDKPKEVDADVVIVNILFMLWIFSFTRKFYTQRFDALIEMIKQTMGERDKNIKDAFNERDARFARLQAILSQTIIRDTQLFDSLTEDTESFGPFEEEEEELELELEEEHGE